MLRLHRCHVQCMRTTSCSIATCIIRAHQPDRAHQQTQLGSACSHFLSALRSILNATLAYRAARRTQTPFANTCAWRAGPTSTAQGGRLQWFVHSRCEHGEMKSFARVFVLIVGAWTSPFGRTRLDATRRDTRRPDSSWFRPNAANN
eukprot:3166061-Pleurochrysis_carterae.AAC.1